MDRLTREHRNVLLIATTNFPKALDKAFLSRADHIEDIGLPNEAARREIISDTLKAIGERLEAACAALESDADRLAKVAGRARWPPHPQGNFRGDRVRH